MKYIIDIPSSQEYSYDKDFKSLDLKFHDDNFSGMTRFDAEPYTEPDRETIENKVWELADYMCRMSQTEKNLCFGFSYPSEVTTNLSYQEAKSLFEKWMKSENEIHVGDEVVFEMAFGNGLDNNMKAVVLDQAAKGEEWCVLTENGCVETHDEEDLCKTGRHFDEVAELLEKMRGEE